MATLVLPDNGWTSTTNPGGLSGQSQLSQLWNCKVLFPAMAVGDVFSFIWNPPPGVNRVSLTKFAGSNADVLTVSVSMDGTTFITAPLGDLSNGLASISSVGSTNNTCGVVCTPFVRITGSVATAVPSTYLLLVQQFRV